MAIHENGFLNNNCPKAQQNTLLNWHQINQLLWNTQKILINYARFWGRLKRLVQAEILIAVYIVKQQNENIFWTKKKYAKIAKRSHAHKGYASSYNVDILNSFNLEL